MVQRFETLGSEQERFSFFPCERCGKRMFGLPEEKHLCVQCRSELGNDTVALLSSGDEPNTGDQPVSDAF